MAIGDAILATKYNSIRTKVTPILGTGSGGDGYGQTVTAAAVKGVSAGDTTGDYITAAQWDLLKDDIAKCYKHQTGLYPTITDTYQGLTIYWAHALQYDQLADNIVTNKDVIYTGATTGSYTAQASVAANAGTTLASGWGVNSSSQRYGQQGEYNVTWTSADAARYFFNSGGYLQITLGRSVPSPTNTKTTGWVTIVDTMNALNFKFNLTNYRLGVAGTTTQWASTTNDSAVVYAENYGYMRFRYIDAKTVGVLVQMVDADAGDQQNIAYRGPNSGNPTPAAGTVVDETVNINISAGLTYRKAIDQLTIETPSFTIPAWTLNA
jgi:hypothetical protein